MKSFSKRIELANRQVELGKQQGILQLEAQGPRTSTRTLKCENREILNFGNCSYLGLETDERLKQAAINAMDQYGVQMSCSRSYVSVDLYSELEKWMEIMFDKPVIIAPSTTMGHFSAIPVLVAKTDAIILDQQVHASVQNAVKLVKAEGVHIETIKHNDMDALRDRIIDLSATHDKVWYMADGIYSMYGDTAPVATLDRYLDDFEQFHLYIDDAHGLGWYGDKGHGYVLEHMNFHDRMVLSGSLSKSFGAGGGVIILPNELSRDMIRNTGGTLMFSGPIQIPVLGACIESAKLHANNVLKPQQEELMTKLEYFVFKANELDLPLVDESLTPVFYIGAGTPETGTICTKALFEQGIYINVAGFPAVPYHNTGLRITINNSHSFEDIDLLLETIKSTMTQVLAQYDYPIEKIYKTFGIDKQREMVY